MFKRSSKNVRTERLLFWSYLYHFSLAKMPLALALNWLQESQSGKKAQENLSQIIRCLQQGQPFSEAVRDSIYAAPDMISILVMAELTGDYTPYFQQILKQLHSQQQLKAMIQQGIRYPLILLVFLCALFFLVIHGLVPVLIQHLTAMGIQELPVITKVFLVGCHFMAYGMIGVIMVGFGLYYSQRYPREKVIAVDRVILRIPLIGPLIHRLQLLKFMQCLAFLLSAKVNLLSALYHGASTIHNPWLRQRVTGLEQQLLQGQSLSTAFHGVIDTNAPLLQYIKIGESTGQLAAILTEFCHFELEQIQMSLRQCLDLLQPVLIIIMGGLIAVLIVAILWPMYGIVSTYAL